MDVIFWHFYFIEETAAIIQIILCKRIHGSQYKVLGLYALRLQVDDSRTERTNVTLHADYIPTFSVFQKSNWRVSVFTRVLIHQ